jgi:hypothetical protein
LTAISPNASRPRRHRPFLIALALLTPIACGPSGPSMAKVHGRVMYLGKPVTKGTISFKATDPDRRNATGQIDADGYYTLQTENPGDGIEVGAYYVSISSRDDPVLDYIPATPVPPKYLVPAKYENPETAGLLKAVTRGGNEMNFDLTD